MKAGLSSRQVLEMPCVRGEVTPDTGQVQRHESRAANAGSVTLNPRATWLATKPDPTLAFVHQPDPEGTKATAALICPPFGWDEMCSYRGLRAWAQELAGAGYPAVRLNLPGGGDSGGSPGDPGRLDAWVGTISAAAAWVRSAMPVTRVTAIGVGLGGLVACLAVSEGAPIEDLILWGVPARGRTLLRQLRAQASLIAAAHPEDARDRPGPDGDLELTGFRLSAETAQAIEAIELDRRPLPAARERRVLLLGRDGLAVDRALREHFEATGAATEVIAASGYAALLSHPQEAKAPAEAIAASIEWLAQPPDDRIDDSHSLCCAPLAAGLTCANPQPVRRPPVIPVARQSIELAAGEHTIRETALWLRGDCGRLFAMLSESADLAGAPVCAVWLNGGALRHIGPNRVWVEVARRWAARGVPTLRIDLEDIGDSDGDNRASLTNSSFYTSRRTDRTLALLDQLAALGLPQRFILGGLCSGAYWSLQAALADDRVVSALMINLVAFQWSQALMAERATQRTLTALRPGAFRRLTHGAISAQQVRAALRSMHPGRLRTGARLPVEAAQAGHVDRALDRLAERRTEALFLFSEGEPLYNQFVRQRQLDRLERWPGVTVERIPSRDHMFRALRAQRHVHDALDRALDRVLDAAAASAYPPAR